jgi:hypothetical protein
MANVAVTPQQITEAGIAPTYTGSLLTANVYQFANDGRTFLHVKKSGAGAAVATLVTIADTTVTIPATTGDKMIGPLPPGMYNDANGLCSVSFDEITGLTLAVLRL